jgi:transcriptional regulator with XRE-family HTH domain
MWGSADASNASAEKMVAKHFGISFQAVHKYEAGHSRIAASALYRLCELLDVPPTYFSMTREAT